jgi:hypothetical protein
MAQVSNFLEQFNKIIYGVMDELTIDEMLEAKNKISEILDEKINEKQIEHKKKCCVACHKEFVPGGDYKVQCQKCDQYYHYNCYFYSELSCDCDTQWRH